MNQAQIRKMQRGRRAAQREKEAEALIRVRFYLAWLRAGSDLRKIPSIPSDEDWRTARRRGIVK